MIDSASKIVWLVIGLLSSHFYLSSQILEANSRRWEQCSTIGFHGWLDQSRFCKLFASDLKSIDVLVMYWIIM